MLLKLLVKLEELTKRNDLIPHVFATFLKIVESFKVNAFFWRFSDGDSHLLKGQKVLIKGLGFFHSSTEANKI